MRGKNLGGVYDLLTPEERFRLVLEAAARQDEPELERLADTCPRYRYTSVRSDPAFTDRLRASRQITICVAVMLMETSTKLTVIKTVQECVAVLSRSLVTEFDRGYLRGWEDGCDHAWCSAGNTGPFPWRGNGALGKGGDEVAGTLVGEAQNADGDHGDDELEAVAEVLATEVRTIWEAFSRLCRTEMGSAPETVLLAWVPPMVGWIEGALNAADGVDVDADVLLEYETALTDAWRELLREI